MLGLIAAVFTASLLGSFHCAGMCGAFVLLATGGPNLSGVRQRALQSAYHLGRLTTYLLLGAAAGLTGQLVNLGGTLAGLQRTATYLAAAMMIGFALLALLRGGGVHVGRLALPPRWIRCVSALHRRAMNRPPLARAALIGLLTTLLPCGWLYAFAVTAAGTGHPMHGAIVMAVFWAGTLPALIAVGVGVRRLIGPLARHAPTITALMLAATGVYTLVGRSHLDAVSLAATVQASTQAAKPLVGKPPAVHQAAAAIPSVPQSAETPACCRKESK